MREAISPRMPPLVDVLFPLHCLACRGRLDAREATLGLCRRCRGRLSPVDSLACCGRCLRPLPVARHGGSLCLSCSSRPGGVDRLVAVWWYLSPLREIVHAIKFRRLDFLAAPWTGEALARGPLAATDAVDLVVPAPLAVSRRLLRGFDQAEAIAIEVGRALRRPVVTDLVARPLLARRQSRLGRRARQANRRHGWRLSGTAQDRLKGRTVLLVDDVVTTGATLDGLADALRAGGARSVCGFALAATPERAPTPRRPP